MRIAQLQIAVIFHLDNQIVLTIGNSLKKMQEIFKGNVQVLNNLPDFAPPDAPRIIYNCPNFLINISLMRFDIVINIPMHISSSIEKAFEYMDSFIYKINEMLIEKNVSYEWAGFVGTLEYLKSRNNQNSLGFLGPVFDKLITINRNNQNLASFNLQYGFLDEPFYINYNINGYEKININIPNLMSLPSGASTVNPEIVESGIAITLDINNKPQKNKMQFKDDFKSISLKVKSKIGPVLQDTQLQEFV
jgi:hypothetical protein